MRNLYYLNTEINSGFWKFYEELNKNVTLESVYKRFKETGRFEAFKCKWEEGQPNRPHIFWDSDVAKWIEGASYILERERNDELEKIIDETVDDIEKNQFENGYFNSYYIRFKPDEIFSNRDDHELYCTGHLIEAAIAYHKATGKRKLLDCMIKNVDFIYKIFVEDESAAFVTPGHEEIEIALLKLYKYTNTDKYLELAKFFIDKRGDNDKDGKVAELQSHIPAREMSEAVGHAVRACYFYTAMAMLSKADNDADLKKACMMLFENITNQKMSVTGGIGADHHRETFSYPYDLPNSDTYNETCAAIALAMFAGAMQEIDVDGRYGDIVEKVYFNSFISGLSLSGDKFFYTNPLEIDQKKYKRSTYQPPFERVKVFSCSCCPPNVVRMLASIPRYAYTIKENAIYCNQFIDGVTTFEMNGKECVLTVNTNYPNDGRIIFKYSGEDVDFFVRIPEWCCEYKGETERGFAKFRLVDGDKFELDLPMEVHFVEGNPNAQDNSGRYAVTRGPIVYCMEGIDNGDNLRDITLIDSDIEVVKEDDFIPPTIYMYAERRKKSDKLYRLKNSERENFKARLIPYFSFSNRGTTDMLVWTMVK